MIPKEIKEFFNKKFKDTRELAKERNVHWGNCLMFAIQISLTVGIVLSLIVIFGVNSFTSSLEFSMRTSIFSQFIQGLANYSFMIIPLLIFLFLGRYIVKAQILFFSLLNKAISKVTQKIWYKYWKKHRKDPAIATKIVKAQDKADTWLNKKPKWLRRVIKLGLVVIIIGIQIAVRLPSLIESTQQYILTNAHHVSGYVQSPIG